jgi:hypothetical protein
MAENVIAGAKITELFGVDITGIDPATSVALTQAVLAQDGQLTKVTETGRRVIITRPKPGDAPVLANWSMRVHDADTGEDFVDGTSLSLTIRLGEPGNWKHQPIVADICRLTSPDGEPLGSGQAIPVDGEVPFAWFRYAVAEMRIQEA